MEDIMRRASKEQMLDVTEAFLQMKKFDIKMLQEAFEKALEE